MRPDILFIYPHYSVKERYGNRSIGRVGGHLPPLGLAQLAAFIREQGFTVELIDAVALDLQLQQVMERVAVIRPRAVGITALTSSFYSVVSLASHIRTAFPDILTLVGGPHASAAPTIVMNKHRCFDLLVFGEGEFTLLEIMERYRNKGYKRSRLLSDNAQLAGIDGIVFRDDMKGIQTAPRQLIDNLDALPLPARDLLPTKCYIPLPNQYRRLPVVHMTSTRGCPNNCSFCSAGAVFGRKVRRKSVQRVIEEIEHVVGRYGAREISFWDDNMVLNRNWMMALCDALLTSHLDITWTCYARVDAVDPAILGKMKAAGCFNIFYGFESGSQELLDLIDKKIRIEDSIRVCRWTREAGIEVRGSFMLGLPGETPELARQTIRFALELDPDYAQFSLTTPYPGTRLYKQAKQFGRLSDKLSDYHGWKPVFVPYGYDSQKQLLAMERLAMLRFYFRPRYWLRTIRKVQTWKDFQRVFKGFRMALGFLK
ncbi:MAG: B12-binding domain-containing radical SAM protein [Proteobacteria bacterium]|nr:B12-binding domain-containing radical SAM protein [Pseudomonadota bacterium]MBU4258633.1 B12-binding domain-containing radical SAM protein [Pseudomonadota bacterium]MBU4288674.1 B12-binding domain-containing radical SAM protein [Pseudomonadota bacterium]MBU4414262.1 B12-binding domain-containing radical SAM protein [Pseudomonadota bacterium]MCG2758878.1 B12-binding domain-containing radical SAM protein [Desulfobacteraceae bacterium]